MFQCPSKDSKILPGEHADIQPGATKSGFAMLTAYISFSSLKSRTEPPLGVRLSNGIPQRPHARMAGAMGGVRAVPKRFAALT